VPHDANSPCGLFGASCSHLVARQTWLPPPSPSSFTTHPERQVWLVDAPGCSPQVTFLPHAGLHTWHTSNHIRCLYCAQGLLAHCVALDQGRLPKAPRWHWERKAKMAVEHSSYEELLPATAGHMKWRPPPTHATTPQGPPVTPSIPLTSTSRRKFCWGPMTDPGRHTRM
jgi:hypothetical protein